MALMKVKARPGVRVPKEGAPREYITDAEAVEVSRSPYYLRRLADSDLHQLLPDKKEDPEPEADAGEAPAQPVKSRKTSQEKAS